MIVAAKRILVDGTWRNPGDPVPEALGWRYPAVQAALDSGHIEDPKGELSAKFAWQERGKPVTQVVTHDPSALTCCGKSFLNKKAFDGHVSKVHRTKSAR